MPDIAIVGGGPAGLSTAARCAEAGLDVVVLEEHATIGQPTHCTGIISLETAEFAKIPDEIVLKQLRHARLHSPGGEQCDIEWRSPSQEDIVVIDRADFDRLLLEESTEAGARVMTGMRVDQVRIASDGVQLSAGGTTIRAQACVLASGVSYRLHKQLGLPLPRNLIHTAQIEVDSEPSDVVELHFGRTEAPDGFLWTVPILRDDRPRLKVGVMARGDAAAYLGAFLRRPEVRRRVRETQESPIRRLLPLRPISPTYSDRVLVVGDAGGFTKPTTGGGIFYSLLSADLAATTLVESLRAGRADAETLSAYQRRWQDRLAQELRVAGWLRRLLTRCSDAEIDALIVAAAAGDVQAVMSQTVRFNWHRDLIVALVRHPAIVGIIIRSLFR